MKLRNHVSSSLKKKEKLGKGCETGVYYSYNPSVAQVHIAGDIFLSSA